MGSIPGQELRFRKLHGIDQKKKKKKNSTQQGFNLYLKEKSKNNEQNGNKYTSINSYFYGLNVQTIQVWLNGYKNKTY